jgi:hypothetical protein
MHAFELTEVDFLATCSASNNIWLPGWAVLTQLLFPLFAMGGCEVRTKNDKFPLERKKKK